MSADVVRRLEAEVERLRAALKDSEAECAALYVALDYATSMALGLKPIAAQATEQPASTH